MKLDDDDINVRIAFFMIILIVVAIIFIILSP